MNLTDVARVIVALSITPLTDTLVLRVFSAGVYALVGLFVVSVLNKFIRSILRDKEVASMFARVGITPHILDFTANIIRYYLYFIVLLVVLGRLGVSSVLMDILVFVLIIAVVVAAALALRNIIPNAAAGIYISSTNIIKRGDSIEVAGVSGKVREIDLVHTVLDKNKSEKIIIPNTMLIKHKLIKK
ncbi:hypothetical protein COT72_05235 [archaeon CG10_big_fil_rev_8_21_14_0_10_43_11]|nr:MAG: hypothetical protein COT72_05235 [archaeon CG10_big_fil_rev_8_21_14_0_10_43_11]